MKLLSHVEMIRKQVNLNSSIKISFAEKKILLLMKDVNCSKNLSFKNKDIKQVKTIVIFKV
jgi:hypothetical protein